MFAEIRRRTGWTLAQLAEQLGVTPQAVHGYEAGRGYSEEVRIRAQRILDGLDEA